jgi:hypothetical protein
MSAAVRALSAQVDGETADRTTVTNQNVDAVRRP